MRSKLFQFVSVCLTAFILLAYLQTGSQATASNRQNSEPLWREAGAESLPPGRQPRLYPEKYRLLRLDVPKMERLLSAAPPEVVGSTTLWDQAVLIDLPMPGGGIETFQVLESPIMEAELAAKFPEIKTYLARRLDDPSTGARLDLTPHGFHAIIFMGDETVYIDPFLQGDNEIYASYYKRDYPFSYEELAQICQVGPLKVPGSEYTTQELPTVFSSGSELRTYRLAVAATGEYTQFHGGTVIDGMAAITTAINRVTGVYEREVAVRMVLIANNDLIVYTDGSTDPYSNNNGSAMLSQNQTNLDNVIGNENYDIGHVFSTGGGGVAYLEVPCETGWKARGVTGSPNPINDPFVIDYVAHEMGHQYGANHTFNGILGSCAGGNRNASTAYEPGSATTIMGYAGICGADNIQPNSDDYFHTISWQEIIAYTHSYQGSYCAVITPTGNQAPEVDAGTGGFTIPKSTPFTLVGSGSDPDGDDLTFAWEEFDLGPAGSPNNPVGNAPIFRSFPPVSTPERTFPQISDIVNNRQTKGEILPLYARSLTFRLTARDNHVSPSAGGVAYDTITFSVSGTAGPFLVTQPNTAVTWLGGTIEEVTWDVAGTASTPINCSAVDISLSTDGGYTYPVTILEDTPNDGTQEIIVPNEPTTRARVRVSCSNNIFFDISNYNFTIQEGSGAAVLEIDKTSEPASPVQPGEWLTYTVTVVNNGGIGASATTSDEFPDGLVQTGCNGEPGDLNDVQEIAPGGEMVYTCPAQADPDLAIQAELTASTLLAAPGDPVTYTIAITNPTTLPVEQVTVSGTGLPECQPELGDPFELEPGGEKIFTCAAAAIDETTTSTITVSGRIGLENTATTQAPEDPRGAQDSPTVNNEIALSASSEVVVEIGIADLEVEKTSEAAAPLKPGDWLTYTVRVENTGSYTANTRVTDQFPDGLVQTGCNGAAGDLDDQQEIEPGGAAEYVCPARVDPALTLTAELTASASTIMPGEPVTYTVTVSNPTGLQMTGVSVTVEDLPGCQPDLSTTFSLAPGEEKVFTCRADSIAQTTTSAISASARIALDNTAYASAPEDPQGEAASPVVSDEILLEAGDSVDVTATMYYYLPLVEK